MNAVIATRELVTLASSHRKPNESVLSPISNYVAEVIYTSTSNTSGLDASTVSILTSIASAAQALNWVTVCLHNFISSFLPRVQLHCQSLLMQERPF